MTTEKATFGGGCFWCLEAVFDRIKGVETVQSGYSGGFVEAPVYDDVCAGTTGHAEVVQITYDPKLIEYKMLLDIFFLIHDPTTLNRQGNDVGTQYRSVIFYHNQEQKDFSELVIKELEGIRQWPDPIVTELKQFEKFYPAENYHQDFFKRNPTNSYCNYVIPAKLEKVIKKYKSSTVDS